MVAVPTLALQFGGLFSLPGIVGALVIVLVVILVARFVLNIAWKIAIVVLVIALALWVLGMLGPLAGLFGGG